MNFKRYNESDNSWTDSHYIMGTDTDTITSLPTTIYPNASSITVGIKGNTTQSGTPSPSNPVVIDGTGDRTGNLAYKIIENANISADGLIATASGYNIMVAKVAQGQAYSGTGYVYAFFNDEPDIGSTSYNESKVVNIFKNVTAPISGYVAVRYGSSENPMINEGSTALSYEPYGYKIPISSASTTTPVYLGEVQSIRQIKKHVFTGQENWTEANTRFYSDTIITDYAVIEGTIVYAICTHYGISQQTSSATSVVDMTLAFKNGNPRIYIRDASISGGAEGFKTYLQQQYAAGTPVTVWYILAEPETAVVNEPLMKIGDYADTVSGITIPTITGADSFDVPTALKPSEASLNYTGWHDATVQEWDGSQWNE